MPTYEYECRSCNHRLSTFQSIKDEPLRDCPECGEGALRRIIFPVGILKSSSTKVLSSDSAARQERDRVNLAVRRPEKFDELLSREKDAGGRLPVDVVDK